MMTTDQIPSHDSSPSEFVALVVDSDPASRLILRGLLESQGGHVIEAENSSAAKAVFGVCAPDIAVLSVTPETGGFEACAQIRALPNNVATPVLTILDLDDEITVDRALAAGAADYVTKPIRPVILRQRIRRLLRVHNIDTAMLRAKREWETAFDAVPDLIILTDLNGKIIRCNLAAIQHLETICTELIGRDLRAVLLQSTGQELNLPFREPCEMQFPSLPGWFEVRTFPGHLEGRWHTIVYVLKDVTERKQLQESVQNSERRFKALVENISEGIQLLGFNGKTIYASPTALRITGYSDEYIGSSPFDYLHPDDVPHCLELFNQLSQQPDTVMTAEIRTRHKNGKWIWLEVTGHNLLTEPGIESILVHFKDITERKQDELKFRQLSQAVEQSPISIVITDPSGNIEYVNPRFTQLTGYSFREVVGQNPRLLKSDQTPPETFVQLWAAISSGHEWHGEFINRKKSGELFAERASVSPVTDEKGRVTHFLALKEDVTERKQLEEALQQNEKRFRAMIENSADAIALVDAKGRITYATPAITAIGGYQPEDYVGHKAIEFIHPEDQPGLLDDFTELVQATGGVSTRLFRARHIDGSWRWVDVTTSNQLADPAVKAIIANFRDVTEGKRAEELLKQTEEHLRLIVETVPIPILIGTAAEGTVLFANTALGEMIGLPVEELLGRRASDFYLDPSQRQALLDIMKREGKLRNYELAIKRADQTPLWVLVSLQPLIFADQPATVAVLYDITERKHAEAALAESEQRFRQFFAASPDAVLVVDPSHPVDWKIVDCNEAACQMNSYTREEMIGHSVDLLNAKTSTASERADYLERLRSAGVMHLDAIHRRKDGTIFPVEISTTIFTVNGRELILGIDRDVTQRKQAEEALRASQSDLSQALQAAKLGYWEYDIPNDLFIFNDHFYSVLHTSTEQEGGYTMSSVRYAQRFCHPDDRDVVATEIQKALNSSDRHYSTQLDHRILYADGGIGYISVRANLDRDGEGRILRFYGANQDVTERKHAEEALRLSQERFEMVAHATNDAVWDLNLATGERWWNSGVRSLFGYSADPNALDQAWWEAQIHPDDRIKVLASFQAALNGDGQFWSKEYRFRRANGTYAYVFDRGYISQDEHGLPVRVIGAMMDLTDRKQSEDALRAREQQLEEAQRIAHLGNWEWDPHTNVTIWSKEMYQLHDWEPGSIPPNLESFLSLIHLDDQEVVIPIIRQAMQNLRPCEFDYRIILAKGEERWLHGTSEFLKDETGRPLRFRGTAQDITERKRMEEALRESEEVFSKAFHASPAPMGISRVDSGVIIDVNGSWERLFGYSRQAVLGRSVLELHIYSNPHDRPSILQQIHEQGKVIDYELKVKTRSDEERILLMSAQIVEIRGQACLMSAFYDIGELRRLHESMLASQKLADLGTLAAGVAHEMNSPLQVITGLSQSLLRKVSNGGVEPGQLERNLDVIQRNGWRCAEIVRSLHTYARNSGGAMEPTHLNELVCDGLLLIEHQLKSWANISVRTILSEDLPPLTCDRNQITQILINLLTNARDAMPNGGEITITTGHDPKSDQVMLQISDTGIGIPNSIRSKIFDPFFTTKPLDKGTGLGLSIVDGIVRAHGGTIEVDAALPQGTIFTARFPAKPLKLPASDTESIPGRFNDVGRTTAEKPI